jgi:hypothetical protein
LIDPQLLARAFSQGFSPLPGRCLIEMDKIPTMSGLLHIPDSARELRMESHAKGKTLYGDSSFTGKVLSVSPRRSENTGTPLPESFSPGDRVVVMLLKEDLNQKMIVTQNTRVYAVIENED